MVRPLVGRHDVELSMDTTLIRVCLLRRVPPHDAKDYVSYPTFIAEQLVAMRYARVVLAEENLELDSPRLYLPHGRSYSLAQKD